MKKGTVIIINGGLGKCILFTAVAKAFKQLYPEVNLILISAYPEVFLNNRAVAANFSFSQHGLWETFVKSDNYEVFAWDPYMHEDWMSGKPRHLIDVWCDLLDIDSLYLRPELVFSGPEVEELQRMISTDKPLLVVQSSGGSNPSAVSWTRNPPKGELDLYLSKFVDSHFIVHLCQPGTPQLHAVHQRLEGLSRRQAMCLVYYCNEFVGIDSFGLHARAANPNPGPSTFFFPLQENINRLGYPVDSFHYPKLTAEASDYLENSSGYYSSMFRFAIEESADNCPIPAGVRWFEI